MTTRGWLYVIILAAILAFIFRPAFAAIAAVIPIWSVCMLLLWKIEGERKKAK